VTAAPGDDAPAAAFAVRDAAPADVPAVLRLVRALATYERLEHRCVAEEEAIHRALFGAPPYCRAVLAEAEGREVGIALWHTTFSTFSGRPGYWLEDIFVEPHRRGIGIGRALLAELARRLAAEGGKHIAWRVLRWNEPSIAFSRGLGAEGDPGDWEGMSLSGEALARLAR
jgi:GNAT superfamily N-acetyltransferase